MVQASIWDRRLRAGIQGIRSVVQRSEEHTSELQSQSNLVCRLLLEKKKKKHRKVRALKRTSPSLAVPHTRVLQLSIALFRSPHDSVRVSARPASTSLRPRTFRIRMSTLCTPLYLTTNRITTYIKSDIDCTIDESPK